MINEKLVKIFNEEVSGNDNFSFKFKSGGELVFNKELEKKLDDLNPYENLHFFSCVMGLMKGLIDIDRSFDVITSFGVLEHLDNPKKTLQSLVNLSSKEGLIIISCPSFLNIRGVIWMTLQLLFDVPMSLSDKHFLTPSNIISYLEGTGKSVIHMKSVDNEVTQGDYFSKDMRKRLNNALSDASLPNDKVELLIEWVDSNKEYFDSNKLTGANMVYLIK